MKGKSTLILAYAEYLREDKDMSIVNKRPSERWYLSFWSTFCPLYYDKKAWAKEWLQLERRNVSG